MPMKRTLSVPPFEVVEPLFEAVRLAVNAIGENYTAAYIQGISGKAFRIAGICPCAPTCSNQMGTKDLIHLLGYEFHEHVLAMKEPEEAKRNMATLAPKIRQSLDKGRPVLVWHAFTNAEWDLVTGYDDEEGVWVGRGSYSLSDPPMKAKQDRPAEALDICPAYGGLFVGRKVGHLDARAAELTALREAVRHAHARQQVCNKGWQLMNGLECYDRWIADWKKPDKKVENADAYCVHIYASTHRAAARFLWEIAAKYPEAEGLLREAGTCFATEADALDAAERLIGWMSPASDEDRRAEAPKVLAEGRNSYAAAIGKIEEALNRIG